MMMKRPGCSAAVQAISGGGSSMTVMESSDVSLGCDLEVRAMRSAPYMLSSLVLLVFCEMAGGEFMMPVDAPVDRLIANTTAFMRENPEDSHAYYTLARIHYLAFINKSHKVGQFGAESPPTIADGWWHGDSDYHTSRRRSLVARARWAQAQILVLDEMGYASMSDVASADRRNVFDRMDKKSKSLAEEGWLPKGPSTRELVDHAVAAVENFRKAIGLAPKEGLYYLGYGSLLEQYVQFLEEEEVVEMPSEFRAFILLEAKEAYYEAYRLSIRSDLRHKEQPIAGLHSLVGYEAGRGYVRISESLPPTDREGKERLAAAQKNVKKLDNLPVGAITPIVFSLETVAGLSELLAPNSSVRFDLDGDGRIERWPWVKPTTGILVWDAKKTGQVKSGRQLIGSVTWWLFFEDGYHVLDALDDDRDGNLAGSELTGLAVWFDRDSDGVSNAGEVVPIEKTAIASLATKSTSRQGRSPANEAGLVMSDGRVLPTYDWVTEPADDDGAILGRKPVSED